MEIFKPIGMPMSYVISALQFAQRSPNNATPKRSNGTNVRRMARVKDKLRTMQGVVDTNRRKPAARSATPLLDKARAMERRMAATLHRRV